MQQRNKATAIKSNPLTHLIIKVISTTLLFFSIMNPAFSKEAIDQIVAVVNDDVITNTELDQAVQTTKMQMAAQKIAATPKDNVLKKQVLDQLINKKLQLQAAKQSGINISEADLDKTISGIAKQNHISLETLYKQLGKEGMSLSEYRKEIRDQLTMQKLQQQEIVNNITVSPKEVDDFLLSKAWRNSATQQYHIEDVVITLPENASTDEINEAKEKAKMVMSRLKNGENLKKAVREATNKEDSIRTQDLGWRKLEEIPSAFIDKVAHMKEKSVAEPIQTDSGIHVLRMVKIRQANDQASPNRKQAEQYLLHHKFEEAMKDWVSKLRNSAFIQTPDSESASQYA